MAHNACQPLDSGPSCDPSDQQLNCMLLVMLVCTGVLLLSMTFWLHFAFPLPAIIIAGHMRQVMLGVMDESVVMEACPAGLLDLEPSAHLKGFADIQIGMQTSRYLHKVLGVSPEKLAALSAEDRWAELQAKALEDERCCKAAAWQLQSSRVQGSCMCSHGRFSV